MSLVSAVPISRRVTQSEIDDVEGYAEVEPVATGDGACQNVHGV